MQYAARMLGHGARKPVTSEVVGAVAVVSLDRPEAKNALSPEVMAALADALEAADRDPAVGCIVVEGSDDVFAAGADLPWLQQMGPEGLLAFGSGDWPRVRAVSTPLVAGVSGLALGGGFELALTCDMVVASETASFGLPEILLGLIPGAGGTQRLPHLVGRQRASEIILTGRRIDAEEALSLGLVNRVVPVGAWREATLDLAARVAERSRTAARLATRSIRAAERLPLDQGLEYERRLFEQARATGDCEEGIAAFLERRVPVFPSHAHDTGRASTEVR
jgi:enoyl-CoA hydratase